MISVDAVNGADVFEWARGAAPALASMFVKGSVVLGMAALAAVALRRASAAVRHLVWSLGLMSALLVVPLSGVLPAWRIGIRAPVRPAVQPVWSLPVAAAGESSQAPGGLRPGVELPVMEGATSAETLGGAALDRERMLAFDASAAAVLVWLLGGVLLLGHLGLSRWRVGLLQARAQPLSGGPWVAEVERLSGRLGLRRPPRLFVSDEPVMPMVWGIVQPVLMLPASAAFWPHGRRELVLLHELAHIRRRDALTQLLAELTRAVCWFNPLVWLATRRLYLEREHACDDVVLNTGTRATEYADQLLALVRSLRGTRASAVAAIAMARPAQLKVRLQAVLDDARSRTTLSPAAIWVSVLAALLLVLPVAAALPFVQAEAAALPVQVSAPAGVAQRMARPANQPPPALALGAMASVLPTSQQDNCGDTGRRNISHNSDGGLQTIRWTRGRCSGAVRVEGRIRLADDLSGISSISAGGLFRLEDDDGRTERRLEVRPGSNGLVHLYRVNGREAEFDAAARAWFGRALLNLVRTTGLAADQRVAYLMRTGGVERVQAEVQELTSDYVKGLYLRKLLEQSDLSTTQLKASVDLAAREISSDYELARVLMTMADQHPFTVETRSAFVAAAAGINSDYEQRRVLASALSRGGLSPQDVSVILESASRISSDYERATLLIGVAGRYKLDSSMRQAYLKAAQGIRSDYEQRRVYAHLIKQGDLGAPELAELLNAASTIRSDYEKAQMLTELASNDLSDPRLQQAFLNATRGMRSSYEHKRVLGALLERQTLADGNIELALESAAGIGSDYELAQVLLAILKNHTLNERQAALFKRALNTIGSDYEYGRVASALLRSQK